MSKKLSPTERRELFSSRLSPPTASGCLEWTGSKSRDGYGYMGIGNGRIQTTHRYAYEQFVGEIPDGRFVCHKCDNPSCCNVNHLFLGTNTDNMRDMASKGRTKITIGESHHEAKLTDKIVLEMRASNKSHAFFARKYNVFPHAILQARSGASWKHLVVDDKHPLWRVGKRDKLNEHMVRKMRAETKLNQRQIAKKYGVCFQNVSLILSGKTWKHIK